MAQMVVFDLGGVMVRINRTWQDCAESCGIRISLPDGPPVFLWDLASFNRYQMGVSDLARYYKELGEELAVSAEEAETLHASILREAYPGTLELGQELHARRIRTGILSNTNEAHWLRMMQPAHFPNIAQLGVKVASFEIQLEKPDARIYRKFEEIADCRPGEIVFFDDAEVNVLAARECGWTAHTIDPYADTASQMREFLRAEGLI